MGGCLGRGALFILLLAVLIAMLSFVKRCNRNDGGLPDEFLHPGDLAELVPVDTVGDWYDNNIQNPGPYLPDPDDNYITPPDPEQIVDDPDDGRQFVGNKLNVMLDSEANDDTFRRWSEEFKQNYPSEDHKITYYDPLTKLLQLTVPPAQAQQVMNELPQKISDIKFLVFPEGLMGSWGKPDDPVFRHADLAWYFGPVQAYDAWDVTMGSDNVTVAVVDTFFDLNHEDLNSQRIVKPYSIPRRNGDVNPPRGGNLDESVRGHGTLVAALAVGNGGNGRGSCGIAPKCKLMPVSMGSELTSMTMLQGMLYAIYQGADVVNISAGAYFNDMVSRLPVQQQIELARGMGTAEQTVWDYAFNLADARNVTIVWAAGNQNVFTALDPSKRGKNTVRVAATDRQGKKASFSDYGNFPQYHVEECTVAAPGTGIFGPIPFNSYGAMDGTSFSAPITAGAIALLKSKNKNLKNSQIISILRSTGKPVSGNTTIGPLLQIRRALDKV